MIRKILEELDLNKVNIQDSDYCFNGITVPRTTHILSSMLHEDYLMQWANVIGLYKRKKYQDERDKAAFIGSCTHESIENYMKDFSYNLKYFDIKDIQTRNMIENAIESYILWYSTITKENIVEVVGQEQQLVCPWFGGTYDMIIRINNKTYLVDFKTSNHIDYKYFLQMGAYKFMLNNYYNTHIDGVIILQLDKKQPSFEEYVLVFSNPQHAMFMDECIKTYLSLVYAYYNRLNIQTMFKNIF